MQRVFNFFIQTNIFISLCAVALTLETQVQLGMKPQWHPYLFLIFFATLFDYNLHRLITITIRKQALKDEKHAWVNRNLKGFYLLVIVSVLGFLISVCYAKIEVLIALAPMAMITIFYSLPVFKRARSIFRLREIPMLKIFLIAFVWSGSTIFLPVIQHGNTIEWQHTLMMLTERFIFVFAITIPFDIRDVAVDKTSGIKTIPILIGVRRSIILSNILLLVFYALCLHHYYIAGMYFLIPAFLGSTIITMLFINNQQIKESNYYHYGWLDGTLLIQGLLVCLAFAIQ